MYYAMTVRGHLWDRERSGRCVGDWESDERGVDHQRGDAGGGLVGYPSDRSTHSSAEDSSEQFLVRKRGRFRGENYALG